MKKSIQERLAELRKQREQKMAAMNAVLEKSIEEGRTFDESEQQSFDELKAEVDSIDKQIENLEVVERAALKGGTAASVATQERSTAGSGGVDIPGNGHSVRVVRTLPKGTAFTRYAMALAAARGNTFQAAEIAKSRWSRETPEVETILRAAVQAGTTTDPTWAAPLAEYTDMSSEFIELLRPETFIGRMNGFRNVPFNVRMPRQTAGAVAGWVGQGAPKPVSELAFDQVTVPHAKVAVIVAITEELARFSTPSAEATVRQDLVETTAQFLDRNFIDPLIAPVSDVSPGAITNGITAVASTGGTVAQVTADLNAAMTSMAVALIPQRSRYWLLHPRTANYLRTLRTSQDIFAFRDEMSTGRLMGIPFIESTNMPLRDQSSPASAGSLETYIVLVEASEIFMADDGETMLDSSREASLQLNDAPSAGAQQLVSMWQNNMVAIRAERYVYWMRRRAGAVYVIENVTY